MPKILNAAHPLVSEGVVFALFGANELNTNFYDFVTPSRTFTPDAGVVFGTGTYGKHFKTDATNENIDLSAVLGFNTLNHPTHTIMMVCNTVTGDNSRGLAQGGGGSNFMGFAYDVSTGEVGLTKVAATTGITLRSTSNVSGTSFSVAGIRNGGTNATLYVNGVDEGTSAGAIGANSSTAGVNQLGAYAGQGSMFAEFVYFIYFTRALTTTEILDIHNSLGANNAISLLVDSATDETPDPWTFPPVNDVAIGTQDVQGTGQVITGMDNGVSVTSVGGEFRINGGPWVTSSTMDSGDTIEPQVDASGSYNTSTQVDITIGTETESFIVTTRDIPRGFYGRDIIAAGDDSPSVLAQYITSPANDGTKVYAELITGPSVGDFYWREDGVAIWDNVPDDTADTIVYDVYFDEVLQFRQTDDIYVGTGKVISLSGITSSNAFGTTTFDLGNVTFNLTGIASSNVFGTLTLVDNGLILNASGFANTTVFGALTFDLGNVNLNVTGIAATNAFGTLTFELDIQEVTCEGEFTYPYVSSTGTDLERLTALGASNVYTTYSANGTACFIPTTFGGGTADLVPEVAATYEVVQTKKDAIESITGEPPVNVNGLGYDYPSS